MDASSTTSSTASVSSFRVYQKGEQRERGDKCPVLPDATFKRDDVLRYLVFRSQIPSVRNHIAIIMGEADLATSTSPNKVSACQASALVISRNLQRASEDTEMPSQLRKLVSVAAEIRPQLISNLVQKRVTQLRKLETLNMRLSMDDSSAPERVRVVDAFQNLSNMRDITGRRRTSSSEKDKKEAMARAAIASFDPLASDADKNPRRNSRKFNALGVGGDSDIGDRAGTPTKRFRR